MVIDLINKIFELKPDWDGYDAIIPSIETINRCKEVIGRIDAKYLQYLDEESIFANNHGTITIEWRNHNVVSIEIGLTTLNYYSIIEKEKTKSGLIYLIDDDLISKIEQILDNFVINI